MRDLATSVLEVVGFALISVGFGLVAVPAGVVFAGISCLAVGFLAGRKGRA